MSIFKGSGVAIITPFNENGIDFEKFKYLIEWHIKESTDAIIVCGTTGEATTMTEQEKKEAIKFTVDTVHKRIPVIAGTGGNNTKTSIEMVLMVYYLLHLTIIIQILKGYLCILKQLMML